MKRSELYKLVKNIDACEDAIRSVVAARTNGMMAHSLLVIPADKPGANAILSISDPDLRDVAVDAVVAAIAKRLENLQEQLMSVCPSIDLNC